MSRAESAAVRDSGALDAPLSAATWIDLSLTLSNRHPSFWPGHMPFQRQHWGFDSAKFMSRAMPYQTGWWVIDEHSGTHFDAPTHFIPAPDSGREHAGDAGRISGHQVSIDRFRGPAAVIDVTQLTEGCDNGLSRIVEPDVIEEWERTHRQLREGDVVLLHSGWSSRYLAGDEGMPYAAGVIVEGSSPGWPAPSVDTVASLHERGVKTIGTDAPTIGSAQDGMPVHWYGLSREIVYVEGLARLSELPAVGAWFVFLPVKVEGSTGGPGRAVGIIPEGLAAPRS